MNNTQTPLPLSISQNPGEPDYIFKNRARNFKNPREIQRVSPQTLLAQLLKRIARRVMDDVTSCPPHQISPHLERLRDITELIDLASNHGFIAEPEREFSGMQLAHPSTVMDYRACLDHTKQYHRAPRFTNYHDEIINRLDLIFASVMRGKPYQRNKKFEAADGAAAEQSEFEGEVAK